MRGRGAKRRAAAQAAARRRRPPKRTVAAQGAAKRAAALTHRLLAFSRRQTLDPKPTDPNRLIRGMEDLVRRTTGPGIEVEVVAGAGLWPVLIDAHTDLWATEWYLQKGESDSWLTSLGATRIVALVLKLLLWATGFAIFVSDTLSW